MQRIFFDPSDYESKNKYESGGKRGLNSLPACVFQVYTYMYIVKYYFSYFITKTYVAGAQKNSLNETVLLSTPNICYNSWIRKYSQVCSQNICLSKPMILCTRSFFVLRLHCDLLCFLCQHWLQIQEQM